jgi:hypothetical protein
MSLETLPDYTCDRDGYPTEAFLDWLKHESDAHIALQEAALYFNECGFGKAVVSGDELRLSTGGWSGCEDVIGHLQENVYVVQRWLSHHRGGLWVYEAKGIVL